MNYYSFNVGDYARDTAHLSELEDLAYRRMIDLYYSRELPLPADVAEISRLIRMRSHSDCIAIVLQDFFTLENDGYHQLRIDAEIHEFKEKSAKASKSAKARWKKHKENQEDTQHSEGNAGGMRSHSEGNAKQEPITNKHKTNKKTLSSRKKFSDDQMKFAEWMFGLIKKVFEKENDPNYETWANEVRLMNENDGHDLREMAEVFKWANQDEFWRTNIKSPSKFRKQYSTLYAKKNEKPGSSNMSLDTRGKDYGQSRDL